MRAALFAAAVVVTVASIVLGVAAIGIERRNEVAAADKLRARGNTGGRTGKAAGFLQRRLDAAGLHMGARMFAGLVVAGAIVASMVAGAFMGGVGYLLGGAGVVAGVYFATGAKSKTREGAFEEQLGMCLPMLASNVRAGQTFESALRVVTEHVEDPLRSELRIVLMERRIGVALPVAMQNMAKRVGSHDAEMLATVIAVQSETGGSMADVLSSIAETIQRRNKMRKHVASVTADGRLSAVIIGAIPAVMFLALMVASPGYLSPMFTSPTGIAVLAACVGMVASGLVVIRKLYNIEIY